MKNKRHRRYRCHSQRGIGAFQAPKTSTTKLYATGDVRGHDAAAEIYERVPEQLRKKQRGE